MFIIFGGLPGVGKSTIAKQLSQKLNAVYLRIDSIEQAIKNAKQINPKGVEEVFGEGYMSAYAIAHDNLELGNTVIADSVNSIAITRNGFINVARSVNKIFFEIEVICSDKKEHQHRIETRKTTIPNHKLPTWQDVIRRDYEPWLSKSLTIDTATISADESVSMIMNLIVQEK